MSAAPRRGALRVKRLLRSLHAWLTLFAFFALLFFGLTGFMLNHSGWFSLSDRDKDEASTQVPAELCAGGDDAIVAALRDELDITAPVESLERSEVEVLVLFRQPGREDDVTVDCETGDVIAATERKNGWGVLADIHRGESAGLVAGRIVDAASILLVLAALSGLLLGLTMPGRRRTGTAAAIGGGLLLAGAVWWLV